MRRFSVGVALATVLAVACGGVAATAVAPVAFAPTTGAVQSAGPAANVSIAAYEVTYSGSDATGAVVSVRNYDRNGAHSGDIVVEFTGPGGNTVTSGRTSFYVQRAPSGGRGGGGGRKDYREVTCDVTFGSSYPFAGVRVLSARVDTSVDYTKQGAQCT